VEYFRYVANTSSGDYLQERIFPTAEYDQPYVDIEPSTGVGVQVSYGFTSNVGLQQGAFFPYFYEPLPGSPLYFPYYSLLRFTRLKKEADNALRSGNPVLALQLYRDLLLSTRDREARAALYTNLCACHLLQKQYLDVVSTAERGLQLNPSTALKLRLLSRRANAFSALGQVHSAILDLRKALDLDQENPALTQELALLTQSMT
jgi:tetratricopeptide (TPR) repeat protein